MGTSPSASNTENRELRTENQALRTEN